MKFALKNSTQALTLVGGGSATEADLRTALAIAPICAAADSGAHLALKLGVDLAAVIGDMDSITNEAKSRIPSERFHYIAEQDSTDFDKALRNLSAAAIVGVGFLGGQIDHELAALHSLVVHREKAIVLLGSQEVVFLCPKEFSLTVPAGTRVSLFPMRSVEGRSKGLNWEIDGIEFAPGKRSGTSNFATGNIRLLMNAPGMLCILPRGFIQPVVSALIALPEHAHWRARAE